MKGFFQRLRFLAVAASSVPTPPAGEVTLFADSGTGEVSKKDDAGVVTSLEGAAGAGGARSVGIAIDGAGAALTTGVKGFVQFPVGGTITRWTLVADQAGSIVIDVWKSTYAGAPPTVANTITGTEKPTLSSQQKNEDTTLSSWTTTVTAGDVFGFNIDSAATLTRVSLTIWITP